MVRALFLSLVVALAGSCSGKNVLEPGTVVGTFRVEGHMQMATCGDKATAADPWIFNVRFSRDLTTLYWLQNRAPIQGHVGSDRKVRLTTDGTVNVRPATRTQAACSVTRTDVLEATLGPEEPLGDAGLVGFSSLTGTLSYAFSATEGSDCSDLMDPSVSVLPCSTVYGVNATKVGP
jgi:hypothetical protein